MKRQGDLLIVPVKKIPNHALKKKHLILAEGEATGHKHELDSGELYESMGVLYFKINNDVATLKHEEHGAINFTPGNYKVIRQREYEPNSWKYVAD